MQTVHGQREAPTREARRPSGQTAPGPELLDIVPRNLCINHNEAIEV